LGSGVRLKITDATSLLKSVEVALMTKNKAAKSPDELMKWIKDLNPRSHIEQWKVLDRLPELKGILQSHQGDWL
jgi:hypothetical protein